MEILTGKGKSMWLPGVPLPWVIKTLLKDLVGFLINSHACRALCCSMTVKRELFFISAEWQL